MLNYTEESTPFTIADYQKLKAILARTVPVPGVVHFEIPGEWLSSALAQYNQHTQHTQEKENGQRSKARRT